MCRRYQMPDNVEPFQPKVEGYTPHLVTLRDRLATFSWWPGLGDAGEHHADDAGAFRRPKSSEFPDYQA